VLLLVTGARALTDTHAAATWAIALVRAAIDGLPADSGLYTGDARGPDAWAAACAAERGVHTVEYRLDGNRWHDGRPYAPWCVGEGVRADPGSRRWPLERNRVMVGHAADLAHIALYDVRVLALLAPWARTHGTWHTATLASDAGLRVWCAECPAALGPRREVRCG
jgi:hypothetical protein